MKFLILSLLLFSQVHAVQAEPSQQQTEVAAFFDQYLKNFNDYISKPNNQQAITAATADIHMPAIMFPGNGKLALMEDAALVGAGTQAFLDRLISQQVTQIKWQKVDIRILNDHTALANNKAMLLTADHRVLQTLSSTYVLYKAADGWQIVLRAFQPA